MTPGAPNYGLFVAALMTQGPWASRRAVRLPPAPGPVQGSYGSGQSLELLALGDSIIAGVGVEDSSLALPSQLARALSSTLSRRIDWWAAGVNGQRSRGLVSLLEKSGPLPAAPQLILLSNGINDITRPGRPGLVLERLQAVVESLEQRFPKSLILQLGMPPLGRFPALPEPLRRLLGKRAAAIDDSLAGWIAPRTQSVHLPFDEPTYKEDFAIDGYHPNAAGVRRWAGHLAPSVQAALNGKGGPES